MSGSLSKLLDPSTPANPAGVLLASSPAVLKGVSSKAAVQLRQTLGITTVRELADHPAGAAARAILAYTGMPGFDPGPPPLWERIFAAAPLATYTDHPSGRFRADFGPVYYRGRLDGTARILLVGQDPSTDELLGHRALVGDAGQRVQGLLRKIGITRSYVMVNTYLFGIRGQHDTKMAQIALDPAILSFRNALLDQLADTNPIQVVITAGAAARHALAHWPHSQDLTVIDILHPSARDEAALTANWNAALPALRAAITPDEDGVIDATPYGAQFTPEDRAPLPRFDLPFGVPAWHGAGGTRITWTAP
jgi:uracil-DNA glycosylase